jgi:hypothetical protein
MGESPKEFLVSQEQISQLLSELQKSAQQLNEASDSINEIISSIEKQIIDSKVGLERWVRLNITEPTEVYDHARNKSIQREATDLGFAKLEDGWALAIRAVTYETADGEEDPVVEYGEQERLSRAQRALRIDALEKMPDLIKSLTLAATSKLKAISEAKKLIR